MKETKESKPEPKGGKKAKKLHLHRITITRAKDNSFAMEHHYKDKPDDVGERPPVFAGTAQDMDDLHQHLDDHFGGDQSGEPEGDEGGAAQAGGEEPAAE